MERPFALKTFAVYDDDTLREGLWLPKITLAKARRSGQLRSTCKGHRILYRGQWVIDWLESEVRPAATGMQEDRSSPASNQV